MSPHLRLFACIACILTASAAQALQPIVTDSRIKTFVYNPNEVFAITTEYGYQSNIEFSDNESIETVSVGDRVSWQIIPATRRLFIRAMEENAHTNMTVVTNKRAYQFDLRSSSASAVVGSEALVYVVRFYYPGESTGPMPVAASTMAPAPMPMSYSAPAPAYGGGYGAPMPQVGFPVQSQGYAAPYAAPTPMSYTPPQPMSWGTMPAAPAAANYRYTYSGPTDIAPVKIYDDGKSTYFKFKGAAPQNFSVITASGEELAVPARSAGADMVAVDVIAPRFSLRQSGKQVIVYNESNGA